MKIDSSFVYDEVHQNIMKKRLKEPLKELTYQGLAEFFKVFGDPTRLKIINALLESQMCVCDLAKLLGMSESAISHQLRLLRQARLVRYQKAGRAVFYSLDDEHISRIFHQGLEHVLEVKEV
ncbi:MAG: winged helix-turn-helix transcriptional regulator [Campylobacteraceae bacterium]|nr:winged helix-turn-helix transcriptional regulator [Campylobacteraceae bacterium]